MIADVWLLEGDKRDEERNGRIGETAGCRVDERYERRTDKFPRNLGSEKYCGVVVMSESARCVSKE